MAATGAIFPAQSSEQLLVKVPTVANVSASIANTEYSYAVPSGTKRFLIQSRKSGILKVYFSSGSSTFITVSPGAAYSEINLNPTSNITLYFMSSASSDTVEVLSWA